MEKGVGIGEVIALHKALGGGGGSSGGGVLVVHEDKNGTLDKTWEEISDAVSEKPVLIIYPDGSTTKIMYVVSVMQPSKPGMKYYVKAFYPFIDFESSIVNFTADTYDGYPVVQE